MERRLQFLSLAKQLAFAASCCERQLQDYYQFFEDSKWGHPEILRESLNAIWAAASGLKIDNDKVKKLVSGCEEAAPDTESFQSVHTSEALNAAASVSEGLRCILDNESAHVVTIASLIRDSRDLLIQSTFDGVSAADLEMRISQSPILIAELVKQKSDIRRLEEIGELSVAVVKGFQAGASKVDKSI